MKRLLNILFFLLICVAVHATHNRAGQLLYKHISGYTYEFTQIQFYYTYSPATRQRILEGLNAKWGDNTLSRMTCIETETLPDSYTRCVFRAQHTFPGPGAYTIIVEDPNRNQGIENIPNSVYVHFCVKTVFRIDPNTGPNNTPELLTYPIDKAAVGRRFVHNPSAFDTDGDSLSYEIAICLREGGIEIETYRFPDATNELYVDKITGDYVWDAPVKAGFYNIAMKIKEWRWNGREMINISSILRDMQIEVVDSKNTPPKLNIPKDTCVIAGARISIPVYATDSDMDLIKLTATGGPFQVATSPAENLKIDDEGPGFTNATFTWQTDNSHVRKQPYTVVFKAEDQNTEVKLVSFANYNITVIADSVKNLKADAEKKEIQLEWKRSVCNHASGYEIYRRIGSYDGELRPCDTGVPAGWGYEKVATLNGINNTTYRDNNNGRGLSPGLEYCYRVVAIFADGAKSLPSVEVCASLLSGTPPMITTSVKKLHESGEILVEWLEKPVKKVIDDYIALNPDKQDNTFEYRLFHSLDSMVKFDRKPERWKQERLKLLGDTVVYDFAANTITQFPHYFKVELWDKTAEAIVIDDEYEIASTLYPILKPSDKSIIIAFGRYTPWVNMEYDIYLCMKTGTDCEPTELVAKGISGERYLVEKLSNGKEYCFRIESRGFRKIDGIEYRNTNWSHVACVIPYDNVPPCPPELEAKSICEESRNLLEWSYPTFPTESSCWYDVEKYHIYFSQDPARYPYDRVGSVTNRDEFTYSHEGTMKGCYYVTAVDTAGNQSHGSNIVCLDECGEYDLPNVFTPNGDGINDIFKSYNPGGVRQVDMKIYNRVGQLVFKTTDPDINWDGRYMDTNRFVPSGVYYYYCDVYEDRLTGQKIIPLSGLVHVYYGKDAQPYIAPSN